MVVVGEGGTEEDVDNEKGKNEKERERFQGVMRAKERRERKGKILNKNSNTNYLSLIYHAVSKYSSPSRFCFWFYDTPKCFRSNTF